MALHVSVESIASYPIHTGSDSSMLIKHTVWGKLNALYRILHRIITLHHLLYFHDLRIHTTVVGSMITRIWHNFCALHLRFKISTRLEYRAEISVCPIFHCSPATAYCRTGGGMRRTRCHGKQENSEELVRILHLEVTWLHANELCAKFAYPYANHVCSESMGCITAKRTHNEYVTAMTMIKLSRQF